MFKVWIRTLEQVTDDLKQHTREFDYDYEKTREAYRVLSDMEGFGNIIERLRSESERIVERKREYQDVAQTLGKVAELYGRHENRVIDFAEGVRAVNLSKITWNTLEPEILSGMNISLR